MAEDCVSLIPGVAKLIADKGMLKLCGCNLVTLRRSAPAQQLRQLGDVHRNPSGLHRGCAGLLPLVFPGRPSDRRRPPPCFGVTDDETRSGLLDGLRRWEAARLLYQY